MAEPAWEPGTPGASALREYERRRRLRENRARNRLGGIGVLISRLTQQPQTTDAWRVGAEGERLVARRLEKHLRGRGVLLLHDRRIPDSRANIDHLAVGPGGVTVIDAKQLKGKVEVRPPGTLFVGGVERSAVIARVLWTASLVRDTLDELGFGHVSQETALCFADGAGLPFAARLEVDGVLIDAPRRVADLAARPGALTPQIIEWVTKDLASALEPA